MGATGRDIHIDVPLSNIMLNYRPQGMVADMVFPIVGVPKQSDAYLIWNQGDILRVDDDRRAPGAEANIVTLNVSSATYYCDPHFLKTPLVIEDNVNMDPAYATMLRQGRAQFLTGKLLLGMERRVANLVTSSSNVGSASGPTSAWTDFTDGNSDPLGDIWTAMNNVQDATGYMPNRILFGDKAWRNFRRHRGVISQINGADGVIGPSSTRIISQAQAASFLELDQVLVSRAYDNTAEEGQTATLAQVMDDNVLIYFAPAAPSIEMPSFGYSFRWNAPGIANMGVEIHPYDTRRKAEEIEVGYYQDEKVTSAPLGFLIQAVTSEH